MWIRKNCFRFIVFSLISLILSISISCSKKEDNKIKGQNITIATVIPLTGKYAEYGKNVLTALQIAQEEFTQKGIDIKIIAEDDQAEPNKAVSALNKLIQVDKIKFIIGGFTSGSSVAMYPVAERAGVLMFSPSSSSPNLSKNTPLFFRNYPSDQIQATFFATQTLEKFGKKTASLLYINSDYGVNAKNLFREEYEKIGGKVVIEEAYAQDTSDFRSQINHFLRNKSDCVWLFGYYNEMGRFLKQAREMGLRTQFFGQEGTEGEPLIQIAGEAAEGLIYFVPMFDPKSSSENIYKFVSAFKNKTGREPDIFAAHAYDALHILADAIQAAGSNPNEVGKKLLTVRNYPGIAGVTTFDENGDAVKSMMIKTIVNGQFTIMRD